MNFTVSKAADIACKYHGKQYIGVDTTKFTLVCKQCQLDGKRGSFLDYNGEKGDKDANEDEEFFCHSHPDSKGVFYCEDCKFFICKLCFANAHRSHNSNIPSVMATEFKEKINEAINEIKKVQPVISDALSGIDSIYQELKKMRDDSIKRIKDMVKNVSDNHKMKLEKLDESFKAIFCGIDIDTQDAYNRLGIVLKKINKYVSELDEVENQLVRLDNPIKFCEYKKSKMNLFKDIKTLIADSKKMIEIKVEVIKAQSSHKLDIYKKSMLCPNPQDLVNSPTIQVDNLERPVCDGNFLAGLRQTTQFIKQ